MDPLLRSIHTRIARNVMNWLKKNEVDNLWDWLEIATKGLLPADKRRITQEIETHCAEAMKAHLDQGESGQVAEAMAVAELGDPKAAGKSLRKKHLTEKDVKRLDWTKKDAGSFPSLLV